MAKFIRNRRLVAAGALGAMAFAAGCASAPDNQRVSYGGPYTGAERVYEKDHVRDVRPAVAVERSEPVVAAYYGVEGARLAHLIYGDADAERLDGVCASEVKILRGESLDSISQYCDVPVSTLISFNPGVRNARDVAEGQIIALPRSYARLDNVGIARAAKIWHLVQDGDTIEKIAARYDASIISIEALNPDIDWLALPVDGFIRVPVSTPVAVTASDRIANVYRAPADDSALSGYAPSDFAASAAATAIMPYNLTPSQKAAAAAGAASGLLTVDRRSVAPGGAVTVSAVGLPANSEVTIYRGSNGRDLEAVKTVRTDSQGRFSEPVRVKKSADLGGVIFKATVDSSGKDLQSPRVGVNRLDDDQD